MLLFRLAVSQRMLPLYRMVFLATLLFNPLISHASIIDTGDVIESAGTVDIGNAAYGKREITNETVTYAATHLGNTSGVRGELFITNTLYSNLNELVVGVSGEGLLQCVRDNTLQTNSLILGKNSASNGSVVIYPSIVDLGANGKVIIGDAGSGSVAMDGAKYSVDTPNTSILATLKTNWLTLGAQVGSNGKLEPGCASGVLLGGEAPTLIVGDSGTAEINLYNYINLLCEWGAYPTLSVESLTPGTAQTYVAKKSGSTGTINIVGGVIFNGGDVMRIGLDDLDQPGGVGALKIRPIDTNVQYLIPSVSAKSVKIGPQGTLTLYTAATHFGVPSVSSKLIANTENWGVFAADPGATIQGNLINHGSVMGITNSFSGLGKILEWGPIVTGNFIQTVEGQHIVKVGTVLDAFGLISTAVWGKLTVKGNAHYDGKINILFQDGSYLVAGDQFNILSVTPGNATYEPSLSINIDKTGLKPEHDAVADVSATGIIIRIVQKPGTGADLAISMTDTPDPVFQSQIVTYTINVTNNGPASATGVTVSGTLPQGCQLGNISPGSSVSCTVMAPATTVGTNNNSMSVSGNEFDPDSTNNQATTSTTVNPAADLGVVINAPASVYQGQTVTYNINVTNNGPSLATGVIVSGSLPSCSLGNIASGATASCVQSVTATMIGPLSQNMSVIGNEADLYNLNNNASVNTTVNSAVDLALLMTDSPDPVRKGEKLVYTLTLTNQGLGSATNVSLTDVLPPNISFEGIYTSQGKCKGRATVTCAIGTLSSGATATVKIIIKPSTVGTITNSASVSASEIDSNANNNSASVTTQVKR